MSNPSYTRRSVPVDSKRGDWPRLVADDLNSIKRGYIFAFFFTTPPDDAEIMCIHPCALPFSIPADWGEMVTEGVTEYSAVIASVDTNPAATWTMTVKKKLKGESAYSTIGTWTVSTGGVFSAVTTDNKQQDIAAGDVLKFTAQATADLTAANMAFTIFGK